MAGSEVDKLLMLVERPPTSWRRVPSELEARERGRLTCWDLRVIAWIEPLFCILWSIIARVEAGGPAGSHHHSDIVLTRVSAVPSLNTCIVTV